MRAQNSELMRYELCKVLIKEKIPPLQQNNTGNELIVPSQLVILCPTFQILLRITHIITQNTNERVNENFGNAGKQARQGAGKSSH
jgi:hypothetical protein